MVSWCKKKTFSQKNLRSCSSAPSNGRSINLFCKGSNRQKKNDISRRLWRFQKTAHFVSLNVSKPLEQQESGFRALKRELAQAIMQGRASLEPRSQEPGKPSPEVEWRESLAFAIVTERCWSARTERLPWFPMTWHLQWLDPNGMHTMRMVHFLDDVMQQICQHSNIFKLDIHWFFSCPCKFQNIPKTWMACWL